MYIYVCTYIHNLYFKSSDIMWITRNCKISDTTREREMCVYLYIYMWVVVTPIYVYVFICMYVTPFDPKIVPQFICFEICWCELDWRNQASKCHARICTFDEAMRSEFAILPTNQSQTAWHILTIWLSPIISSCELYLLQHQRSSAFEGLTSSITRPVRVGEETCEHTTANLSFSEIVLRCSNKDLCKVGTMLCPCISHARRPRSFQTFENFQSFYLIKPLQQNLLRSTTFRAFWMM